MGQYSHPWAPTLLGLTTLREELTSTRPEAQKELEGIEVGLMLRHTDSLIELLEEYCDCSFR